MRGNKKNEKKGLFKRLFSGGTKEPCCCSIQLEEDPKDQHDNKAKLAEEKKIQGIRGRMK
ncbi:MAG: hypothetical protein JRI76_05870 [Deltaproteobacteria bacterium]|nr:hypothetical protein [Deltaproteobacteria bacterium]